jgi:ribosome maturation factor RimP
MDRREQRIFDLLEPVVSGLGLGLVEIGAAGERRRTVVRIVLHSPGGVSHGDCSRVTRACAAALEDAPVIDGSYKLEVSSPGIARQMRSGREFDVFRGAPVQVFLVDGTSRTGTCEGMKGEEVVLREEDGTESVISWSTVTKARLIPVERRDIGGKG